ncbi:MAG: hypothetical protein IIC61_10540 [Proteobacteria bacterium]|nr:hypothetical protein [Pseudomonadota bacterium]
MAGNRSDHRKSGRTSREFNFASFLWRFPASLSLVMVTYNPTQYSYVAWLRAATPEAPLGPEHFVVGVVLLIGWVILLAATQRSLGTFGLLLGGALLGGLVWLLTDIGWINVSTMGSATWVGLFCVTALLAVGLSWSHVWRRLTGQFEVDDGDD